MLIKYLVFIPLFLAGLFYWIRLVYRERERIGWVPDETPESARGRYSVAGILRLVAVSVGGVVVLNPRNGILLVLAIGIVVGFAAWCWRWAYVVSITPLRAIGLSDAGARWLGVLQGLWIGPATAFWLISVWQLHSAAR